MNHSSVFVSLRDDNSLGCSFAIVLKQEYRVLIVVRERECAIFDADALHADCTTRYLLLKHYPSDALAYRDFMKLIGKMCTKKSNSKYFGAHIREDNRMIVTDAESEHMITVDEQPVYSDRLGEFKAYIEFHHAEFFKTE